MEDKISEIQKQIKQLTERVAELEKQLEEHKNQDVKKHPDVHGIGLRLAF